MSVEQRFFGSDRRKSWLRVSGDSRRDARLIEHTVEELLGQRIYGLCLGYEDLNDHDQLRTDPMLAVAVNKADPLGRGGGRPQIGGRRWRAGVR